VVLAGERPGGSAFSRELGLPASVLVDVAGKSALARVIDALEQSRSVAGGLLCGPAREIMSRHSQVREIINETSFEWLEPQAGPSASALSGIEALGAYPLLLTAGDHALLTARLVDEFCRRAGSADADLVFGLVPWDVVRAAYPESRRTVLRFSDGQYCGTNLFAILNRQGRAGPQFWRQVEADRKKPWRIARRLGVGLLLRHLLGRLSLQQALDALSSVMACRVAFVLMDEPRLAVDVDSVADRDLAEQILRAEAQASG
jgi:GTP:adenosylcobinamide-phosphate guanylyltransferase